MRSNSYASPFVHRSNKQSARSSVLLLFLWSATTIVAILSPIFGGAPESDLRILTSNVSMIGWLISFVYFLALWFSLQWDLVRRYVPQVSPSGWAGRSVAGLFIGVITGLFVGGGGFQVAVILLLSNPSIDLWWLSIIVPSVAGLLLGFGLLGWMQALELYPHVPGRKWWIGAMSVAWVPVLLIYLGYDRFEQQMIVNIYPDAHNIVRLLACEVALLSPILVVFWLIVRRTPRPVAGSVQLVFGGRPPAIVPAGLLLPPLTILLFVAGLLLAQSLRVEQAWLNSFPAGNLSIDANGAVTASPLPGKPGDQDPKLSDISPNGSILARAEKDRISLLLVANGSATEGSGTPLRTIQVFSGPPPKSYYADDIINIVRFSPDGSMLAVGTGQADQFDSAVNPSFDHAVHIWSVTDGKLLYSLTEPIYSVNALAWSPDGKYLAAGGGLEGRSEFNQDQVIRVWRLGEEIGSRTTAPELAFAFLGHTSTIEALAWNPGSNRLVSTDLDGRIVVWKI